MKVVLHTNYAISEDQRGLLVFLEISSPLLYPRLFSKKPLVQSYRVIITPCCNKSQVGAARSRQKSP